MGKKFKVVIVLIALITAASFAGCSVKLKGQQEIIGDWGDGFNIVGTIDTPSNVQVFDGGLDYPSYKHVTNDKANNDKIYSESRILLDEVAKNSEQGTLNQSNLKKHIAADAQYDTDLTNAPRVVKDIIIDTRITSRHMTGLYLPAGEVVTISIPQNMIERNLKALINCNNFTIEKDGEGETRSYNRMPIMRQELNLSGQTTLVGSPYGGLMEIETGNMRGTAPFKITVSGAVEAPYFRLGLETDADWEKIKANKGGITQLDTGNIRMTMPSYTVRNVVEMTKIMTLWRSIGELYGATVHTSRQYGETKPNYMFFDHYVHVGAGVAFVGADFSHLPTSWAVGSLDYDGMLKNGNWGTMHELGHHHQSGWGVDNSIEVTNNVLSALAYIKLTNIASNRTENGGLNGWNYVSDAYSTLKNSLNEIARVGESAELVDDYAAFSNDALLPMYVNIAHSFGADKLIEIIDSYFTEDRITDESFTETENLRSDFILRAARHTGYDFTEYSKLFMLNLPEATYQKLKEMKQPMFYPVASLYTSGIQRGSEKIYTGRPFEINPNEKKRFDFNTYTVSPQNVTIKSVTGRSGAWKKVSDGIYDYTPEKNILGIDNFTLKVDAGGVKYSLLGQIKQNSHKVDYARWDNIDKKSIDDALSLEKTKPTFEGVASGMNSPTINNGGKFLSITNGKFVPKSSGEYKFYMKADDAGILYFGETENKGNSNEVLRINSYTGDYTLNAPYVTELIKGKEYYFKFALFNNGGKGSGQIGYSYAGGAIKDIEQSLVYNKKADVLNADKFAAPIIGIEEMGETTSNLIKRDKAGWKVLEAPIGEPGDDSFNLIDGKDDTFFHAKYGGGEKTEFPQTYLIDMGKKEKVNFISLKGRNHQNPVAGNIEVYTSADNKKYTKIYSGKYDKAKYVYEFKTKNVRFIKVVVLDNNGAVYSCFAEISCGVKISAPKLIAPTNSNVGYKGKWDLRKGMLAINDALAVSSKGQAKATFKFVGTEFSYFATQSAEFGDYELLIDGNMIYKGSLFAETTRYNQFIYGATDLSNKEHTVVIRSVKKSPINISYFAIGTEKDFLPRYAIAIFAIGGTAIGILLILILLFMFIFPLINKKFNANLPVYKSKSKSSKSIDKKNNKPIKATKTAVVKAERKKANIVKNKDVVVKAVNFSGKPYNNDIQAVKNISKKQTDNEIVHNNDWVKEVPIAGLGSGAEKKTPLKIAMDVESAKEPEQKPSGGKLYKNDWVKEVPIGGINSALSARNVTDKAVKPIVDKEVKNQPKGDRASSTAVKRDANKTEVTLKDIDGEKSSKQIDNKKTQSNTARQNTARQNTEKSPAKKEKSDNEKKA